MLLRSLWQFRYFILSSIKSEFLRRFSRSSLGALWSILNPLAQAAILALVLSEVLSAKLPGITDKSAYAIYLMSGMAAWGLFTEITSRCLNVFIEYGGTMKKIAFPRLCLPVIVGGSALLNHLLLLLATLVVFLYLGTQPSYFWLYLPFGILSISIFAFGLGVLLGVLNVFVRDIGQVFTVVIQLWFWLTPIVYAPEMLPPDVQGIISANPLTHLVAIYQNALLYGSAPDWQSLVVPSTIGLVLFLISFVVFRRASAEIVDAL
jgi:lipopolysaccharide transport system permease protein